MILLLSIYQFIAEVLLPRELLFGFTLLISFAFFSYKRDQECAYLATQSLHNLRTACLLSESGPPSLDFEVV